MLNTRLRSRDALAIYLLLALIFGAMLVRWHFDNWLNDFDILTFFIPNWGYLGDRLRDLELPAWNPYVSSGSPTIGDGGGGWLNFPVMISFTIFTNPATAYKVMMLLQCCAAGISTYWFARKLQLPVSSAFLAGLSYATGSMLYGATHITTVGSQLAASIPVALLCVESAIQAQQRSSRSAWAAGAGLASTQFFTVWPGQGSMYAFAIAGGWMVWRLWPEPPNDGQSLGQRTIRFVSIGVVLGSSCLLVAASAILPLLDLVEYSNVPGGDYSDLVNGNYAMVTYNLHEILSWLINDEYGRRRYGSHIAVVLLTLAAIVRGRHQSGTWFWVAMLAAMIDSASTTSLLRPALELFVPPVEHLHEHRPSGVLWFTTLPVSMLAGIGLQAFLDTNWSWWKRLLPPGLFLLGCWFVEAQGSVIGPRPWFFAVVGMCLLLIPSVRLPDWTLNPRFLITAWIVLLLAFPTLSDLTRAMQLNLPGASPSPNAYLSSLAVDDETQARIDELIGVTPPEGSAAFLLAQDEPFRIVPYAGIGWIGYRAYPFLRLDTDAIASFLNGRPTMFELEQVGGYNPIHLRWYYEYITAVNTVPQDYHWTDIFGEHMGTSQLLDMLNTKYFVVSKRVPADRGDVQLLYATFPIAYEDAEVTIFENPNAFPRAWLVHQVLPDTGTDALVQFGSSQADAHELAFVSGELPLVEPSTGAPESVVVRSRSEESMTIEVTANSNALLVVSEMYNHNWKATLDGESVDVLRTNHALRGIAVPEGTHIIEFRYQPDSLRWGMMGTGAGIVLTAALFGWAATDTVRRFRSEGT